MVTKIRMWWDVQAEITRMTNDEQHEGRMRSACATYLTPGPRARKDLVSLRAASMQDRHPKKSLEPSPISLPAVLDSSLG